MMGHFPESFPPEDNIVSISSSTGDSGYHSQPDATRRLTGATKSYQARSSEESRSQMVGLFLRNGMCLPSLTSGSQSAFHGPQSTMNQMLLPPPPGDLDIGGNPFGMSDFANYPIGQGYSQFDSSALPGFFTPTSEVGVDQNWASDVQTFSAPFAVATSRSYYPPYLYQNLDAPGSIFGTPANSNQRRPRLQRPQLDTTSSSLDAVSEPTPFSAGQHDSRRTSDTDQVFRSFVFPSMMPPTCCVISNPRHASIAESDFTEQSNHFVDVSK